MGSCITIPSVSESNEIVTGLPPSVERSDSGTQGTYVVNINQKPKNYRQFVILTVSDGYEPTNGLQQ